VHRCLDETPLCSIHYSLYLCLIFLFYHLHHHCCMLRVGSACRVSLFVRLVGSAFLPICNFLSHTRVVPHHAMQICIFIIWNHLSNMQIQSLRNQLCRHYWKEFIPSCIGKNQPYQAANSSRMQCDCQSIHMPNESDLQILLAVNQPSHLPEESLPRFL
jgi:hypothetical protein